MRERGIPIPPKRVGNKYNFADWEVGESEVFQTDSAGYAAYNYAKRHPETEWTYRKLPNGAGFRVWRLK